MSWFKTGYEGIKHEEERQASQYGPNRYWMKSGDKRSIVWVDDNPACIYEHNVKLNGDWKNWYTCGKDVFEDAACCELMGQDSRYYIGFFTIIDCSEYVDSKGNHHQYEIKLLPAKLKTLKKLQAKKTDREDRLEGRIYKVSRTDEKSPGCGDDFEYDRDADMAKLFPLVNYKGKKLADLIQKANASPEEMEKLKKIFSLKLDGDGKILPRIPSFNYMELLQPKKPKEIRDMLRGVRIERDEKRGGSSGGSSGGGGTRQDDDVPF